MRKVRLPENITTVFDRDVMKMPTVDMTTAQGRLDWAMLIVYGHLPQSQGLDDCKPQKMPFQPAILHGMSARKFSEIQNKNKKDDQDKEIVNAWRKWVFGVRKAEGQNELTLWALLRCLQIYKEHESMSGSTESMQLVGKFIRDVWGIANPQTLYTGDIRDIAHQICSREGLKELPNNWRAPSEYYKKQ